MNIPTDRAGSHVNPPLDIGADDADKFRSFIENLPVLFYAVKPDPPFSPIYVSPAFRIFGYPLEEWLEDENIWLRVIHQDDQDWVFGETKMSGDSGGNVEYEYRLIAADGSVRWVRDRGCLIRDAGGKILHRQGVIADITKYKLADEEIEKRDRLYRTLAKNIPATGVLLFDRQMRYTLAEGEQLKSQAYTSRMFEGRTIFDVFPPHIADEWSGYYARALDGEHVSFESRTDGGWFHNFVIPVRDEAGEIFAGMVVWQDITDRKQVVMELEASEARYRNIFENAYDIVYVHDLDGNYLSINSAAERVFGYTRDEALKMNLRQIASPDHLEQAIYQLNKKKTGTPQTSYEMDCVAKDGSTLTLEINSCVIYNDGEPVAVQGIARDVTERKKAEADLRESEEKFRTVTETASDAIITVDEQGTISFANAAATDIFGYAQDEMIGQNLTMLMPERMRDLHSHGMARYLKLGKRRIPWKAAEMPGRHRDGRELQLELSFAEFSKRGRRFFTSVIRDVSERIKAQQALKESESRFRDLFENANDLIYTHDLEGRFTSLNRAGERITGYSRSEALAMRISDVVAESSLATAREMTRRKIAGEMPTSYELEIVAKDGRRVLLELSTRLIYHDDKPVGVQGIGRDITSRRRAEEQLMHNALHDSLTDLPNRTEFMRHLGEAVQKAKGDPNFKFAVLFLDLDRFKIINDSLGHVIGDKLLVGIAKRLSTCLRPRDVVARLGGDEFTILLNLISCAEDTTMVAERIQRKLSAPFKFGNYEVFTSASIGIIVSDEIEREPEDFLRDADTAMYRAKEAGKARCEVFDREMHVRNMNLLRVETDLRRAIERDEFEVFYQPIVALTGEPVREFEALIRWNHPTQGQIAPADFIGVAEETGLIVPIGKWILEEACRQTRKWQESLNRDADLCVSVNLSAKQLMHPSLLDQVEEVLAKTGLSAGSLKLEVTESTVIERSERALSVLRALSERGVSLSTDDFGTGYSSLSYLHQFPFDRLKIDRSFIEKMDRDEKSQAIVRTILLLGRNLEMEVVAEGIETERQLELLQALGCTHGQGFFFSRPIAAELAERYLHESRSNGLPPVPFSEIRNVIQALEIQ
jgi:diguanylate cyclase (GGDEF)-like protein/PAS domain S-box-containing protein